MLFAGRAIHRFPNAPVGLLYGGSNHDPGCPSAIHQDPGGELRSTVGVRLPLTDDGKDQYPPAARESTTHSRYGGLHRT